MAHHLREARGIRQTAIKSSLVRHKAPEPFSGAFFAYFTFRAVLRPSPTDQVSSVGSLESPPEKSN
jgi:hypothetical protein